ncbi:MAG: LamG-like jellyroll fold domain-containing protein [Pirellulaceae bacterium]
MSDDFDPYYTWLGIPKEDQPADHYRLIGIRPFEDNADVITNVMDQRMQYLRSMQVGKRSALTQRLLNEISTAGGCLLDKDRKKVYDRELKAKHAAAAKAGKSEPASAPIPKPSPVATPTSAARPIPVPAAAMTSPKPASRPVPLPLSQQTVSAESSLLREELVDRDERMSGGKSSGMGKLPMILGGAIIGGLLIAAIAAQVARSFGDKPSTAAVVPKHPTTKPAKKTPITKVPVAPVETQPTKEPTTPTVPPEPAETKPPETPKVTKTPAVPPKNSDGWWNNPVLLQDIVALKLSKTAQAEFRQTSGSASLKTPITIETWIRLDLESDKTVQILGTRLGYSGGGFALKGWAVLARKLTIGPAESYQLVLEIWQNDKFVAYPIVLTKPQGWHHLAITFEPDQNLRLFLDGEKHFDVKAEKDTVSSGRNLSLGSDLQPDGIDYNAECCGLRASAGIRYTDKFKPPTPAEMKKDETTFAFLDVRTTATAKDFDKVALSGVKWMLMESGDVVIRPGIAEAIVSVTPKPTTNPEDPEKPTTVPMPNPVPFGEVGPPKNTEPVAIKRIPVPTPAELAKGKSEVTGAFGEDVKAAKSPQAKLDLAKKMFAVVKDTPEPPSRFALLQEVRRLALEGKDLEQATAALVRLHEEFEIDLLAFQVKLLEGLPLEGLTAEQRTTALIAACAYGQEALAEVRLPEADALAAVARQIMAKSVSNEAKAESKVYFEALAQLRKRFDLLKRAEQTLANAPDDPVANQAVGLHHYFVLKDAEKGLPMLAKATDAKLAAAAKARQKNLENGAGKATLEEANAWYLAISTVPSEYKIEVQRQALEGYTQIANSGAGLEKAKAEQRRDELSAVAGVTAEKKPPKKTQPGTDTPEFSPGLVGRALVDGKDPGLLLTYNNDLPLDRGKLSQILTDAKGSGGRMVLEGVFALATPATIRVNHLGKASGPAQVLSIDGKRVSAVGAAFGRSDSPTVSLAAGTHLVQWICDFDGNDSPIMMVIHEETGTGLRPIPLQSTRQQRTVARQFTTKAELSLNQ